MEFQVMVLDKYDNYADFDSFLEFQKWATRKNGDFQINSVSVSTPNGWIEIWNPGQSTHEAFCDYFVMVESQYRALEVRL